MVTFPRTGVKIARNFLRSANVDEDNPEIVAESYVVSQTVRSLLTSFANHQSGSGQGAFTWTGPYGSGKSTLALILSGLLSGSQKQRERLAQKIGYSEADELWRKLPPRASGWKIANVVGSNASAFERLRDALREQGFLNGKRITGERRLIEAILETCTEDETSGGLVIVFDELGKCLEQVAQGHSDAYFFQLLAEAAARSKGRLIFIGILHQAFQEYASKLARETKEEWAKIQGRFVDLSVNLTAGEQIELVGNAIASPAAPEEFKHTCQKLDKFLRDSGSHQFQHSKLEAFQSAWPLNPLVTALLGPISRRSYGQSQRSIFSFLASAEKFGLQDFENLRVENGERDLTYNLSDLWDYLDFNLQASIAVSLDAHHFATARHSLVRASSLGMENIELSLIKAISLLEFTARGTGVSATKELLEIACCLPETETENALKKLEDAKLIVFQKFRNAYALFDGSDFDIEEELDVTLRRMGTARLQTVSDASAVSTVIAKRHYLETGSLRWFRFFVLYESQVAEHLNKFQPGPSEFGAVVLSIPDGGNFSAQEVRADLDFAVCDAQASKNLANFARELDALSKIASENSELQRDKVARREVYDRIDAVSFFLEKEVRLVLRNADWIFPTSRENLDWEELCARVSKFADDRFSKAPRLRNELLNKDKPSGNANAALKALAYLLVSNAQKENLGIQKFPAEMGLYLSLIRASDLHLLDRGVWKLSSPNKQNPARLDLLWQATIEFLKKGSSSNKSLPEIYEYWAQPPFGIKRGLMPLLALVFMLTERKNLSFYREGLFLTGISDVDVDYILRAPHLIQIRWMNIDTKAKHLLTELANVATDVSKNSLVELSSLDVARALVASFDAIPAWAKKTSRLSKHARNVRQVFKTEVDPNNLLFVELPSLASETNAPTADQVAKSVKSGLVELSEVYSSMLASMADHLMSELRVSGRSAAAISELNQRASNISKISGDLRINAFVDRVKDYDGSDSSIERIIGLVVNKPPQSWIDNDIDKAKVEMTLLAFQFLKLETVARVAGREDKSVAVAVVQGGSDGEQVVTEFNVGDFDVATVERLEAEIEHTLSNFNHSTRDDLILAALARVSAKRMHARQNEVANG